MTLQARAAPAPEAEALAGYRRRAHGWTACGAAGSVAPSRPAYHQPSLFQLPASPREQKSSLSLEDKFISLVFPWSLLGFTRRISVAWRRRAVYSMVSSEASGVSAGWTQMSPCPARRGCWGGAGGALHAPVSVGVWACHIGVLGASRTRPPWLKPPRRWECRHGSTGHPGRRLSSLPVCQAGS